jgi:hypothetical protein
MDPESISRYIQEEEFPNRLTAIMEERPFMIYRNRDPETGEMCDHFTVVNEDETPRRGHTGRTLMEAFNEAFPEQNSQIPPK